MLEIMFNIIRDTSMLYLLIVIGFLLGRYVFVKTKEVAKIIIYFLLPMVLFYGSYNIELNLANISLPFFIFFIEVCSVFGLMFFIKRYIKTKDYSIIAVMSSIVNNAYFGIPVASLIFTQDVVNLLIFSIIGQTFLITRLAFIW